MGFGPFNPLWNMDPAGGRGIIGPGPAYNPRKGMMDNASQETPNIPQQAVQDRIKNKGLQGEDRYNRMRSVMGGLGGFQRRPLKNAPGLIANTQMPQSPMMAQPQMPQMQAPEMNPMSRFGSVMGGIPRMM